MEHGAQSMTDMKDKSRKLNWVHLLNVPMVVNQFVRHAAATVRLSNSLTGITGSSARRASIHINAANDTADKGSAVRTRGCVQGTTLPPELSPRRRRRRVTMSVKAPRKSTRDNFDRSDLFAGTSTKKYTSTHDIRTNGTWIRKATRHPQTSFIQPPNKPPTPAPDP